MEYQAEGGTARDTRIGIAFWINITSDDDEVEFAFATNELRRICESRRKAVASLGQAAALELKQRLADLLAVGNVAEFCELFPDDIAFRSPTEGSLRLRAGYDLVFSVGHVKVRSTPQGATDWAKVSRIKIIALEASNA